MAEIVLTALYEPVGNGWIQGSIAEFPSVVTAAPTPAGAREMLVDALCEYLLALVGPPVEAPPTAVREKLSLVIEAA